MAVNPNSGNNPNTSRQVPNTTSKPPSTNTRNGSGNNDTSRLDDLFKRP